LFDALNRAAAAEGELAPAMGWRHERRGARTAQTHRLLLAVFWLRQGRQAVTQTNQSRAAAVLLFSTLGVSIS